MTRFVLLIGQKVKGTPHNPGAGMKLFTSGKKYKSNQIRHILYYSDLKIKTLKGARSKWALLGQKMSWAARANLDIIAYYVVVYDIENNIAIQSKSLKGIPEGLLFPNTRCSNAYLKKLKII